MGNNCLRNLRQDPIIMADEGSHVAIGQNQQLSMEPEVWRSDIPMTEGQLRGKRDTFWETAPAYDGRSEIWDALKAACEAVGERDYALAQAILDGANILLPTGRLVEVYDELGNRYVVPKYCINKPINMAGAISTTMPPGSRGSTTREQLEDESEEADSTTRLLGHYSSVPVPPSSITGHEVQNRERTESVGNREGKKKRRFRKSSHPQQTEGLDRSSMGVIPTGDPIVVKIRVSTLPKDIRMTIQASDRVRDVKRRLEAEHNLPACHITMLYSGRVLRDGVFLKTLDIPKGYVIQAIVT